MIVHINDEVMQEYFWNFNVAEHKYFFEGLTDVNDKYKEEALNYFLANCRGGYWDIDKAAEAYRTVEKVYYLTDEENAQNCNLLQLTVEKFLGQYVNIEGIQELFKSSYFYFEWMMHLEYYEDRHNYSYYRDHYIHQIRNLYEMFVFLDKMDFWRSCRNIYMTQDSIPAMRMKRSILEQLKKNTNEKQSMFGRLSDDSQKELYYHYIIFATAIVSSLIHDIGYPIVFMKRTMRRMQEFLPTSDLFMKLENAMPRIKTLLSGSLLFETVEAKEIEERIRENDHGTYSAIILLYQYYDNGEIFSLEPVKRMVIEMSALVIYNHTLRYEFQGTKKAHRYHNYFSDEPLAYLFRLCDDLQEWKRVYFEISNVSNFFVCNKCKMPMVSNLYTEIDKKNKDKNDFPVYSCYCKNQGINTNRFVYRRLLNVAPFQAMYIEKNMDKVSICLKSNLSSLLQVVKYNSKFATHRVEGIGELRSMLEGQAEFGKVYIDAFISNNPIAIKAEILRQFLLGNKELEGILDECDVSLSVNIDKELDEARIWTSIQEISEKKSLKEWANCIWEVFLTKVKQKQSWKKSETLFLQSIEFYLFLILFGKTCKNGRVLTDDDLTRKLEDVFCIIAQLVAEKFMILDETTKILVSDCLKQMFCEVTEQEFYEAKYNELYKIRFSSRLDLPDVIQSYTQKEGYKRLCLNRSRFVSTSEKLFDYYSDYFLFIEMDKLLRDKDEVV